MPMTTRDDVLAEEERRAAEVYARLVRPALKPEDDGKYVAVAFEADDFEIDADDYAATGRLLERRPGARLWLMRTNGAAAYRARGAARRTLVTLHPNAYTSGSNSQKPGR